MKKKHIYHYAAILTSSLLTASVAQAQGSAQFPSFETSSCETVKGYDPDWASYGEEYGLKLQPKKDYDFIFGFYQMVEKDGKLYAAFGGAIGPEGPVKGARPGAVVVLNADTLQYEKAIPLPFHAHAMALDKTNNKLIVTHTSANAFSMVDLEKGTTTCLKPNANIGDIPFQGRYVQVDENGDFYINYNTVRNEKGESIVVKYKKDGKKDNNFKINVIENNIAFPLLYKENKIFTGSKGITSIPSKTGEIKNLTEKNTAITLFNYTPGPEGTLLATEMNSTGQPGLYLFDLKNNHQSSLFTGAASLEVAYKADLNQALVTNLESKTVAVVDLPNDEKSLENRPFRNILISDEVDFFFRGLVSNIHLREETKNTEFFVTQKFWAEKNLEKHGLISKVTLADYTKGIDGLEKPGACTVQTFNMADKKVSEKQPCRIMSEKESYEAEKERIERNIKKIKTEKEKTEKELTEAQSKNENQKREGNKKPAEEVSSEIKKLQEYKKFLETDLSKSEAAIKAMEKLLKQ